MSGTLVSVGLLILVAKLAEGVGQRLRINSIVAYTATGVLLGPVTGLITVTDELQLEFAKMDRDDRGGAPECIGLLVVRALNYL